MEITDIIIFIGVCILSYLLGSISIARLITNKKVDNISSVGSGNPGTMNMLRTHGMAMGLFTLFCDALKGAIPALFGLLYFGELYGVEMGYVAVYSFGLFAVIGHIFPVFYKFKGGKGIATTFGMFMVADPICTLILFGIMFVTLYFIKIGSLVSLLFITIEAVEQMFRPKMQGNWLALLIMCVVVFIDICCHKQNIIRLIENRENPADIQEGLKKDIEKIKNKKDKKLEKNSLKQDKIEKKYAKKINRKQEKVSNKLKRLESLHENKVLKTAKTDEEKSKLTIKSKNKIENND